MTRFPFPLLMFALIGSACLMPADAWAFRRTQTCGNLAEGGRECREGELARLVTWEDPCQTYFVQRDGSDDFEKDGLKINPALLKEVIGSFETWNEQGCSDFSAVYGGETCNNKAKKQDKYITGGNQNVILWREESWPHSSSAVAVTLVRADSKLGLIEDADMEVNGVNFQFAIFPDGPPDPDALNQDIYDVRNVITHEAGHFLGLDHELADKETTMASEADPGEVKKRDLTPDDVAGLCEIYPTQGFPACTSRKLQDLSCVKDYEGRPGCASTGPGGPTAPILILAMMCGLLKRRRQQD